MFDTFSDIPESWVLTSIDEIFQIVGGGTPSTENEDYWNGDIAWISSADIHGLNEIKPRRFISKQAITDSATNLVPAGSIIVVTRVGLGKVAITEYPLCFSQDSQALIDQTKSLETKYFLYFMSMVAQKFIYQSRGTTISGITKKQLAEIDVPLAPLNEQRRIVEAIEAQFSRIDAGIAALKRLKANLKRYKAAVLKAACEGRLVPQDPDDEPASELLKRILAERRAQWEADQRARGKDPSKLKYPEPSQPNTDDLPDLPDGWIWVLIEPLLSLYRPGMRTGPFGSSLGKRDHQPSGIPVLGIENIRAMRYVPGTKIHISPAKARELHTFDIQPKDIIVSRSGTVGEVCVVPEGIGEARFSTNLMRIVLNKDGMLPEFFTLLLNGAPFLLKQIHELCKGSTRDFLNQTILSSLIFPLPPLEEQKQVLNGVNEQLTVVEYFEETISVNLKRAERLKQSILRKAFSGRLVPQDPNDEPASELLKRIRQARAAAQPKKGKRA